MPETFEPRAQDLTTLCASCGACCNGTMFARGRLAPGEARALKGRLTISPEQDDFVQPCLSYRTESGCSVYETRPAACRAYRCKLHREVGDGSVSPADALARVRRIREVAAAISGRLPASPHDLWHRLEQAAGTTPREMARIDPQLALDVAELALRLRRDLGVGEEERGQKMQEKAAKP